MPEIIIDLREVSWKSFGSRVEETKVLHQLLNLRLRNISLRIPEERVDVISITAATRRDCQDQHYADNLTILPFIPADQNEIALPGDFGQSSQFVINGAALFDLLP